MTLRRRRSKVIAFTPELRAQFRLISPNFESPQTCVVRNGARRGTLTAVFRDPDGGVVTGKLRFAVIRRVAHIDGEDMRLCLTVARRAAI